MAIVISQGFSRTSDNPIDETLVLTKNQMKTANDALMPDAYFAICKEDGKFYLYNKTNTVNEITGKYRVLSSDNSLIELTQVEYDSLTEEQKTNGIIYFITDEKKILKNKINYTENDLPSGGTIGQVLTKRSNINYDAEWITPVIVDSYTKTETDILLSTKANISTTYTKTEVDELIPDVSNLVTKTELTTNLDLKADSSTTYTKIEVDEELSTKQDTLVSGTNIKTVNNQSLLGEGNITISEGSVYIAGNGIDITNDIISADTTILATQTDLSGKADSSTTYTKNEVDTLIPDVSNFVTNTDMETALSTKASTSNVYTIAEIDESLDNKQDVLTAGDNIVINSDNIISTSGVATTQALTDGLALKADAATTYTKSEIDSKISGVYHYKGTVVDQSSLPISASVGDVYNVENTGMNYAWTGTTWDALGASTDLSSYYTKTEVDDLLYEKADAYTTYTKAEVDLLIPNVSDFATETELTTGLALKADASTTYTKTEVDRLIPDVSSFVTTQELTDGLGTKQDTIQDLVDIRTGAALGSTALQNFTEVDPTVSSWAKQPNKPIYTAQEVGALPANTSLFSGDYNDLTNKPVIPSAYDDTELSNRVTTIENAGYQTSQNVDDKISSALESFDHLDYKVADSIPTPTTVVINGQTVQTQEGVRYLVRHTTDSRYEEYILVDGAIYDIGDTSSVDLSDYVTTSNLSNALSNKQDTLVSGTSIKTVNNQSILGAGNISTEYSAGNGIDIANNTISIDGNVVATVSDLVLKADSSTTYTKTEVDAGLSTKQDTFVSGTNIKTINSESLLGSGDIAIDGAFVATYNSTTYADLIAAIDDNQTIIVDFTNNHNQFCVTYSTYTSGANAVMYAIYKSGDSASLATITVTTASAWSITHTSLQEALTVDSAMSDDSTNPVQNNIIKAYVDTAAGTKAAFDANLMSLPSAETWVGTKSFDVTFTNQNQVDLTIAVGNMNESRTVPTKAYIESKILEELENFEHIDYQIVQTLPVTGEDGVRYLVPVTEQGYTYYEEYMYIDNAWVDIGHVTDVHLENYYTKTETDNILTDYVTFEDEATQSTAGVVKLNPAQNIGLDANGRLTVGGRMGQFDGTTGLFAPNDREPRAVGDYSLLITDALGMSIGNRAFAVVSGYGLTCKSAAAGATEYRVTNNYNNRILCKIAEGGFASRDEATSKAEQIVQVVSVTINGSSFTPDSAANSSDDIVIKTSESLNPNSAITNIRLFGLMESYATIHTGNGIKSEGGGRNLLLGGGVTKAGSANDNCIVGNGMYSSGNGNAMFGRYHIARKNRGLLAGTGHDTTNAPSEGASAVGQYSYMDANTLFAVGNGSSHTERSNAFEVRSDGIVLKSPNGTRYKITVSDDGTLSTTAIV